MKKSIIGVLVVIAVAVAAVAGLVVANQSTDKAASNAHDEAASDHHHNSDTTSHHEAVTDLTDQSEVTMEIQDFAYSKPAVKIKKGTTVTWTNRDTMAHNIMKEHDNDEQEHTAPTADEVKPDVLAGPLLEKGQSYSFTFSKVGSITYHCAPHPYMQGIVQVVE